MATPANGPGRTTVLVFAFAAGAMVANLYYLQPLMGLLARSFDMDLSRAGLLVAVTQAGYALGVLLIVPLGDVVDRRLLVTSLFGVGSFALAAAAASRGALAFGIASAVFAVASSAAMVIVPYAASLAPPHRRGQITGRVMTGLLVGIPSSWLVAGIVGGAAGWRAMYAIAALTALLLVVLLRRQLPKEDKQAIGLSDYRGLLASLWPIFRAHAELRRRTVFGFLCLAGFSAMWTSLPFLLLKPPYGFTATATGLFGLTGFVGALMSGVVGRLGDAGFAERLTIGFAALFAVGWATMALGTHSLWPVIAGCFALNVAIMGLHVTNQLVILRLDAGIRSRATAIYIFANFVGATFGSLLASWSFAWFGWLGVCMAGLSLPLVLLTVYAATERG